MNTESKPRIILDTNVIISALIFKGQPIRQLLLFAMNRYQLVFSQTTWDELSLVIQRPRFEKHIPLGTRMRLLADLARYVEVAGSSSVVTDCRDPKDNKFLALAKDAGVSMIVFGDKDLTDLHPYKGIQIYSPADFMALESAGNRMG